MDELLDETLQRNEEVPLENQENDSGDSSGDIPDNEIVEDVPETSNNVSENETNTDSTVIEDETGNETDLEDETGNETDLEDETGNETDLEDETGGEIGSEDETGGETDLDGSMATENVSESGPELSSGYDETESSNVESMLEDIGYKLDNFIYELRESESIGLWEKDLGELGATDTLLFMIFLILLVQFIHNFFKGSHWFR